MLGDKPVSTLLFTFFKEYLEILLIEDDLDGNSELIDIVSEDIFSM
jgi:hypothetical protein